MTLGQDAIRGIRAFLLEPGLGDVIANRFELRKQIGEGGMGTVYEAVDRTTGEPIAIKFLKGSTHADLARFAREIQALDGLSHPGVVKCITHGVHDGIPYFVMPRLVGSSLAERLQRGRLRLRDALLLGTQIADALSAMHHAGIVHRDIKPSNIFLKESGLPGGDEGVACLLDLGIAHLPSATALTQPGARVGTPGYMAPEQIRGEGAATSCDVFAFGCVLFECLVGRAPFVAETTYALLARVLLEITPLLHLERTDAPPGLDDLIARMLAKEPAERPAASEVSASLGKCLLALPANAGVELVELAGGVREGELLVGKYRVEQRLGEGGMGIVVAAKHLELGTRVAIKILRGGVSTGRRFLREAQAVSRLESEHVARVLDVGRTESDAPFIVMEYLRGVDLARRLADLQTLAIPVAVDYVQQACDAVGEAHALGIVHRDLKPSNLFLVTRRDGTELVKVLDFGISKVTEPLEGASLELTATADSTILGSIAYMSPEQLKSAAQADARSDIWSLGVVLYEMLAGLRPFDGESAVATAAKIASSNPPPLRSLRAEVSEPLSAIVHRCLAKDPNARYQEIAELELALEALSKAPAGSTAPTAKRPRFVIAGIASVVVVAGAVLASGATARRRAQAVTAAAASAETSAEASAHAAPLHEATSATGDSVDTPAAPASLPSPSASPLSAGAASMPPRGSVPTSRRLEVVRPSLAPPSSGVKPTQRSAMTPSSSAAPVATPPGSRIDLRDPALEAP